MTGWLLDVTIAGVPAAQGSKRHVGNGRLLEQSKAVAPWRTLVAWTVSRVWHWAPLDGPVYLDVEFVMRRPASTPKRRPTPPAIRRPDTDKMLRAVFDALTGVCWRDDSQVVWVFATKRIAETDEQPGCRIRLDPATGWGARPEPVRPLGTPPPGSGLERPRGDSRDVSNHPVPGPQHAQEAMASLSRCDGRGDREIRSEGLIQGGAWVGGPLSTVAPEDPSTWPFGQQD